MRKFVGIGLLLASATGLAFAGGAATVPEIDPATGVGALALLGGALLIIRARRAR